MVKNTVEKKGTKKATPIPSANQVKKVVDKKVVKTAAKKGSKAAKVKEPEKRPDGHRPG